MKQFNNLLFQSEKLIEGKQHPDIEAIVGNKNATRNEICYSKTCSESKPERSTVGCGLQHKSKQHQHLENRIQCLTL